MNYQNVLSGNHLYYCHNNRALYHMSCGSVAACVEYLPQPYCACEPGKLYCGNELTKMNWNAGIENGALFACKSPAFADYNAQCTGFCLASNGQNWNSSCHSSAPKCAGNSLYCGYELTALKHNGAVPYCLYRCDSQTGNGVWVQDCENGCVYSRKDSYCETENKLAYLNAISSIPLPPVKQKSTRNVRKLTDFDRKQAHRALYGDSTNGNKGDLVLTRSQQMRMKSRVAINDLSKRWPHGIIYYVIDSSLSGSIVNMIKQVAYDLYLLTNGCIRWVERTNQQNYVKIVKGDGCFAYFGVLGIGAQNLSLGIGCENYGIVIHELLHTVGFAHEQTRPDRDDFLNVYYDNIIESERFNFDKTYGGRTWTAYDFNSIMHYGEYAFAKDESKKTLEDKNKKVRLLEPYDKPGMTESDIYQIKKFYEGICALKTNCNPKS